VGVLGLEMIKGLGNNSFLQNLVAVIKHLGSAAAGLCFPKCCGGCEKVWLRSSHGYWCEQCTESLPWIKSPLCPRCGRPFLKSPSSADHLCGACLLSESPCDTARSATHHSGVVRERINQLKFGGRLYRVPPLVELLVKLIEQSAPKAELVIPVPLHVRRLRQRGFNQAGLLAGGVGRHFDLPVRFDILRRRFWTEPQTRLKRADRLVNVKNAFEVKNPAAVENRSVLLVDDVYTTGTTVGECAKVLKAAGAEAVHAVTVSRALPDWKPAKQDPGMQLFPVFSYS
jgi:ComF family protein